MTSAVYTQLTCVDAKRVTASFCTSNVLYSIAAAAGSPIAGESIGRRGVNRRTDFENIFARISDSKRDFNGFPDPAIAADCRFFLFLGPDFGLCV